MADPIEEAAKLLGIDAGDLRKIQADKQRGEVKDIVREVLEEFFGSDDDDGDGDGDDDSLRGQARKAAAGKKTTAPKKPAARKKADDDDEGDEEPEGPASLAKRLGLAS